MFSAPDLHRNVFCRCVAGLKVTGSGMDASRLRANIYGYSRNRIANSQIQILLHLRNEDLDRLDRSMLPTTICALGLAFATWVGGQTMNRALRLRHRFAHRPS